MSDKTTSRWLDDAREGLGEFDDRSFGRPQDIQRLIDINCALVEAVSTLRTRVRKLESSNRLHHGKF